MLESVDGQELDEMKATKYDFSEDFRLPGEAGGIHKNESPEAALSESTEAQAGSSTRPGKHRRVEDEEVSITKKLRTSDPPLSHKTQDQLDSWNCIVCTLYVFFEFKFGFRSMGLMDLAITELTSQNTLLVLLATLRGEIVSG